MNKRGIRRMLDVTASLALLVSGVEAGEQTASATSLTDAILMHGGEAQTARDGFEALAPKQRVQVLA